MSCQSCALLKALLNILVPGELARVLTAPTALHPTAPTALHPAAPTALHPAAQGTWEGTQQLKQHVVPASSSGSVWRHTQLQEGDAGAAVQLAQH